jgi:hypothetical protein
MYMFRRTTELPVAHSLNAAFGLAKKNQPLPFDEAALLARLHLDKDTPDGIDFINRILDKGSMATLLRQGATFIHHTKKLVEITNQYQETPRQFELAHIIGTAITRQLVREDDLCPTSYNLVMKSERPDIISLETKERAIASERARRIREIVPASSPLADFSTDNALAIGQAGLLDIFGPVPGSE